jgi:hypothetical protein
VLNLIEAQIHDISVCLDVNERWDASGNVVLRKGLLLHMAIFRDDSFVISPFSTALTSRHASRVADHIAYAVSTTPAHS